MLSTWTTPTRSPTPRWCPSRTTRSSATAALPPWCPDAGSIDWLCLPTFDSAACFARLLGTPENGRWLLTVRDATTVTRHYVGDSFVLETTYETPGGTAVAQETMPLNDGRADLVRRLVCTAGSVEVEHEWVVRFGYGGVEPWVRRITDEDGNDAIRAIAGPDSLLLRGDRLPTAVDHRHADRFTLHAGESSRAVPDVDPLVGSAAAPSHDRGLDRQDPDRLGPVGKHVRLHGPVPGGRRTVPARATHAHRRRDRGHRPPATTSLPEDFGGERNWDYRFCWLRDAAMTLEALLEHGYRDEATQWRDWLLRAVAGSPADLQIMYRVDGARDLPEQTLDHLPGYDGARPVRIGNAAVDQVQNDVLGEVMCALEQARAAGLEESDDSWSLQRHLVEHLLAHWREPDRGIWEVRGEPRHFTHSKVMAWAAVDRAVRAIEVHGLDGPLERWRAEREAIHADVLSHGWNAERGTFVQSYGAAHTDASLLAMAPGRLPAARTTRGSSTLAAIRSDLEIAPRPAPPLPHRPHRRRRRRRRARRSWPCSFWLADALARTGDVGGPRQCSTSSWGWPTTSACSAEQYDPVGRRMAGNLPQALSHLALVRAVHGRDAGAGPERSDDVRPAT